MNGKGSGRPRAASGGKKKNFWLEKWRDDERYKHWVTTSPGGPFHGDEQPQFIGCKWCREFQLGGGQTDAISKGAAGPSQFRIDTLNAHAKRSYLAPPCCV